MFGYCIAAQAQLSPAEQARYRACYCGLCRAIGARSGQVSRCCLTYDMVFLALLLGSLYEPPEAEQAGPCPLHPFQRRDSLGSAAVDYAADLNVILAYYNCLDDWADERRPDRGGEALLLRAPARRAAARQPRQAAAIRTGLAALQEVERRRDPSPDPGANAFGALMGELFVWKADRWEPELRTLGEGLGRFIYLLDGVRDRERDQRRGQYNPLSALYAGGLDDAGAAELLTALLGEGTAAFERLPLVQDVGILRNILYRGVWGADGNDRADGCRQQHRHAPR